MKDCRYTLRRCDHPHLLCKACPRYVAGDEPEATFVPESSFPRLPDPHPYVKIGSPSGKPGFGIEIGIKGTF